MKKIFSDMAKKMSCYRGTETLFAERTNFCNANTSIQKDEVIKKMPETMNKNMCHSHTKPFAFYCKVCCEKMCARCAENHKESINQTHEIIEISKLREYISGKKLLLIFLEDIETVSRAINNFLDEFREMDLPDFVDEKLEGIQTIEKAKQVKISKIYLFKGIIQVVDQYFEQLKENYQYLYKKLPSKDNLENIYYSMTEMLEEFKNFEQFVTETGEPSLEQVHNYFNSDFETRFNHSANSYEELKDFDFETQRVNLPQLNINLSEIKKIENNLSDYINTIATSDTVYNQMKKIRVNMGDYFLPEFEAYLPKIDPIKEKLTVYNLKKNQVENYNITSNIEIPNDSQNIITPNSDIYICGGITKDGAASQSLYCLSMYNYAMENPAENNIDNMEIILEEKCEMPVSKMGNSLCFVRNQIYSIGGCVSEGIRTNICEKYDIETNKWIPIASMHKARSRPVISSFNDTFIYVFYGNSTDGSTEPTIEYYNILENKWALVNSINGIGTYEISFGGCLQVNSHQILLFGGMTESKSNKGSQILMKRRALLFNPNEECFVNIGDILPIDFCQSCQPVVYGNTVFGLGFVMKSVNPKFNKFTDIDYAIKIDSDGNFTCKDIVKLD